MADKKKQPPAPLPGAKPTPVDWPATFMDGADIIRGMNFAIGGCLLAMIPAALVLGLWLLLMALGIAGIVNQ